MTQAKTPRWYCVNNEGIAIPLDGKDAAQEAVVLSDLTFQSCAPHRAVQLVEYVEPAQPTVPTNSQEWAGMDGAIAYHLIDRHAESWADAAKMMGEWLAANQQPAQAATEPATTPNSRTVWIDVEPGDTIQYGDRIFNQVEGWIPVPQDLIGRPRGACWMPMPAAPKEGGAG